MNTTLTGLCKPITVPASWLYGAAIAMRNRGFDKGRRVQRVDNRTPVISVGNITTGGVGKSPMVAWIVDLLSAHGHTPVIAMRGYRARPGERSDEEADYLDRFDDIHVLANPDRIRALKAFLPMHPGVDCVLLDDGFQHRFVHRDLDLVLIDATRNTFRDELLPAGRLREPIGNLKRADAVIITHAFDTDDLIEAKVQGTHGKKPIAWADHRWTHLRMFESSDEERWVDVNWLKGKGVITLLGVGNPEAIIVQLEKAGARVMANIPAGDHEPYDRAKMMVLKGLCSGAQAVVMTSKDWVKARDLIDLPAWPVPIVVPHLTLDVYEGVRDLQELILRTVEDYSST